MADGKVSSLREVFETAGGSLRDYASVNGYPLSPLQITRIRRLWESYTDAFNDLPHSMQFRYCGAFVRDYMRCRELKLVPPPQGITAILDNIYMHATSSPRPVPPREQKNVRVPFVAMLRGIFPFALQPLGYDEMELAELECSFRGALDEVATLNTKPSLFSFKRRQPVVAESASILSVHPNQPVPIAALVQWWSLGSNRKTRPWTTLRMTEKQFLAEIVSTFDQKGTETISFCDFWVLHNRLFPPKKYVREKKQPKTLPATIPVAVPQPQPQEPAPVEQPAVADAPPQHNEAASPHGDADGITEEYSHQSSEAGGSSRPRRGSDATDISVHSSISQAATHPPSH